MHWCSLPPLQILNFRSWHQWAKSWVRLADFSIGCRLTSWFCVVAARSFKCSQFESSLHFEDSRNWDDRMFAVSVQARLEERQWTAAKQHRHNRHLKTWLVRLFLGRGNCTNAQKQPTSARHGNKSAVSLLVWFSHLKLPNDIASEALHYGPLLLLLNPTNFKRPLHQKTTLEAHSSQSYSISLLLVKWGQRMSRLSWGPCHQNRTRNSASTLEKSVFFPLSTRRDEMKDLQPKGDLRGASTSREGHPGDRRISKAVENQSPAWGLAVGLATLSFTGLNLNRMRPVR